MLEIRDMLPRLGHVQRNDYLETHYGLSTNKEISIACGVHESTIDLDIKKWKTSGEYDEWLDRRWHYYLESETVDDRTKFLALTRLKEKRIATLSLSKVEHSGKIGLEITKLLEEYKDIYEIQPRHTQPLQEDDPREPVDTSLTP